MDGTGTAHELFKLVHPETDDERKQKRTFEERLLSFLTQLEEQLTERHRLEFISWWTEEKKKREESLDLKQARKEAGALPRVHAAVISIKLHDDMNPTVWSYEILQRDDNELVDCASDNPIARRCRDMALMRYRIRKLPHTTGMQIGVGVANKDSRPGIESEWLARLGDSIALIVAGMLKLASRDDLITCASKHMLFEAVDILFTLPELRTMRSSDENQPSLPFF